MQREPKAAVVEKQLDQQLSDLVEYVKWISVENSKYKERVRKAEKVINDLRSSGEANVDKLMENLYNLKISVSQKEAEAERMRDVIKRKEDTIMAKENQKASIKQQIEINNADRENEIHALRQELRAQQELMEKQTKHQNELMVNCERVQDELITASNFLGRKEAQERQLCLQKEEMDQATVSLKNKYG